MDKFKLLTEHTLWWIIPALVCSVFLSIYLYKKDEKELTKTKYLILVSLRGLLLLTLFFLLINPLINYFKNKINSPHAVIIVDNSESVSNVITSDQVQEVVKKWEKEYLVKGIQPHFLNLEGKKLTDSLAFNESQTNLDHALNVVIDNFQSENLASITLLTDGIVNEGMLPYYKNYGHKVNIVGLGDTIIVQDVAVHKVNINPVSFTSKKIPVEVAILANGLQGHEVELNLFKGDELVQNQIIDVQKNEDFLNYTFYVVEEKEGIFPYSIKVTVPGIQEKITSNNVQKLFLKVVDKSQKILILAEYPHPDIKFIRTILKKNQAYDLTFHIKSHTKPFEPKWKEYDLVILHGSGNTFLNRYKNICSKQEISLVLFSGMNTSNGFGISMNTNRGNKDEVQISLNKDFKSILLSSELSSTFKNTPPLEVPFGDVKPQVNAEILAFQKVGSIETDKPLIVITNKGSYKTSRILGEGWWKVRLRNRSQAPYFDELFGKVFEYALTNRLDKKMILKSLHSEYSNRQPATVEIRTYDLLGNQIIGEQVKLSLFKGKKKVREVNTTVSSKLHQYNFSDLDSGVYRLQGAFELAGQTYEESVEFAVNIVSLEGQSTVPDFSRMRNFVENHGGIFSRFEENNIKWITSETAPNTITTTEDVFSIIEYKWIILLLLGLAFFEWILRKIYLLD